MSLTYTTAPTVEVGRKITSTQVATLARAFNDRLRAGVADCAWRVLMWYSNLWRQVRNPAEPGYVFPPQMEAFDIYHHLDPEYHLGTTWPVAGPGEFEGANLANPIMQFVFGLGPADLDSEDIRLGDGLPWSLPSNATLADFWLLGKLQRGAYDPATGAQNAPAWEQAQKFFTIVQPYYSYHGKSYGGYFPTPTILADDCGTTESDGLGVASYEIKFTALRDDVAYSGSLGSASGTPVVVLYAGSCPNWTADTASGHVLAISDYPLAWVVYVNDGSGNAVAETFLKTDWIEGPYTGEGELAHGQGQHLQRVLHAYASEMRGADSQRSPSDTFKIKRIAADWEQFYTSQYQLAPNYADLFVDELFVRYPTAQLSGENAAGTAFTFENTGASYEYQAGYVIGGFFLSAENLGGPVTVGVYADGALLKTVTLVPDETGSASAIRTIADPDEAPELTVRLLSAMGGGTINFEASQLVAYKPQPWDGYLVSRCSSTQGGSQFTGGVDGRGKDLATAKRITDDMQAYGAAVNQFGAEGPRTIAEWVNDNPIYDTARRMTRDHCRIIRRNNFLSYAVEDGKTVLRFSRYAYGMANARADMFHGIAPPIDQVILGSIVADETYVVRSDGGSGTILYRGTHYHEGQTFTGVAGSPEFEEHGDGLLYIYDGIKHTALKKGFTNEWVLWIETKCYHPSATSIWKEDAYSDYFAWCNRCHFYSGTAPARLLRHFSYGYWPELDGDFVPALNPESLQFQFLSPEAPSGYNYIEGANRLHYSAQFFSACQIYKAPYEVESCVVERYGDDAIVKLTLTERMRSHPDAPATVDPDVSTWDTGEKDDLAAEDYRTDDNALREYVLKFNDNTRECTFKIGDDGTHTPGSGVSDLADNPFGSCYPHFFMVKLIPEPYSDGNDVQQSHDSRTLVDNFQQMETYLRGMCEGYVDGQTTTDIICESGSGGMYDFTFANLCFQAFGGNSLNAFDDDEREDYFGHGPVPNTVMRASVFNRFSSAVNLLTRARLDVPIVFEYRDYTYSGELEGGFTDVDGSSGCSTTSFCAAIGDSVTPAPATTLDSVSGWNSWVSITASAASTASGCPYKRVGSRVNVEYAINLNTATFTDIALAIPDDIQELINNQSTGTFVNKTEESTRAVRVPTTGGDGDACEGGIPDHWQISGVPQKWEDETTTETGCLLVSSGVLVAPGVPVGDYGAGNDSGGAEAICPAGGASSQTTYDLITDMGAFVEVPLV